MKRRLNNHLAVASLALLACATAALGASPVPITNAGFEDPVLAEGAWVAPAPAWSPGKYDVTAPTVWIAGAPADYVGAWNPGTSEYIAGAAPEGLNMGFTTSSPGFTVGMSQVLSSTLQAEAQYDLSVKIGNPVTYNEGLTADYRVELLAGGVVLQSATGTSPADGTTFTTASLTYGSGTTPAQLGQPLEIRILAVNFEDGYEVDCDDVQLTVTLANPAANPGGPYSVQIAGGWLSLDGSASLPSDGATITTYDWDLDNDGDYDEGITGANPAAITSAALQSAYGMSLGPNTIQLKVTDSAAKTSTVSGTVALTALPSAVAYWPMRDGLPGTPVTGADDVIDDPSHPATDGTVSGNSNATWEADPVRGIVYNTSEGNRLLAGTQGINLNVDSGFTWSIWAKVDSSNITDPGADCLMGTRAGTWNKMDRTSCSNWINPTYPDMADDTWHHWVFVGDTSGGSVYRDGVLTNKDTSYNGGPLLDKTGIRLEIGGTSQYSEDVTGLISDVAIWRVALTEAQIQDIYNGAAVVPDTTAPFIADTTPPDDDPSGKTPYLQAFFDEPVTIGTGNIRIVNDTTTTITTIAVGDAQVSASGASITINPTTPLTPGDAYHIEMDTGVVKNLSGIAFAGIGNATTWNFTVDSTPPTVAFVDSADGGPIYADLAQMTYTVTFDEPVDPATVSISSFTNAGTATINVVSVTVLAGWPANSVFELLVEPSTTGTLQLQVPSGQVIKDVSGNPLVVPALDDTTIDILSGSNPGGGTRWWDGPTTTGITDGVSQGGTGTWDTTTTSWDRGFGFAGPVAWNNANNSSAIFGGTAGTVTVAEPISLSDLTFDVAGQYTVDGGTLNFAPDSTIRTADNRYDQTITSVITGSPNVETKDFGAGNQYKGLIFAPASGTQTLGDILNPNNTGNTDKAGVALGGSTSGNSVASINYAGGDRYGAVYKTGTGTWTTGNITTGNIYFNGGTLIVNGTAKGDYSGLYYTTGKLSGDATLIRNDRRGNHDILSGFTMAPGNAIGTITFADGTTQTPNATQQFTIFRAGAIYEWEVGPASQDTVHIAAGKLQLDGFTLKILDAGGTPAGTEQLPVFTYDPAQVTVRNLSLGAVVFDTSALGPEWTIGTLALTDDGAGTIYLTGLSKAGGSNTYATWLAGYPGVGAMTGFTDDPDGDGNGNGLENFFGTDPSAFTAGVMAGTKTGNTFTFTHPQNASPATDITVAYSWSTDLATFTADGVASGGTTVKFSSAPNTPTAGTTTVTATITGTSIDKLFVRVTATQN